MKIKCNDGIVRDFQPVIEDITWGLCESYCKNCKENLGCNDTKIAKKNWKSHICKPQTQADKKRSEEHTSELQSH